MELELEHGDYTIRVQGQIIITSMQGSFNDFSVQAWSKEVDAIVAMFKGERFAMLFTVMGISGGTPGALMESEKHNQWLNTQNLVAKAIVNASPIIKDMSLSKVPSNQIQNIQYFNNEEEAFMWLRSELS